MTHGVSKGTDPDLQRAAIDDGHPVRELIAPLQFLERFQTGPFPHQQQGLATVEPAVEVLGVDPHDLLQLGQDLLTTYLVPFEIASVLLLAALVGAILIGREKETRSAE